MTGENQLWHLRANATNLSKLMIETRRTGTLAGDVRIKVHSGRRNYNICL